MIIKSVEVKNFRSIRDAHMKCDSLTAILGRNGAGKSSFLYALSAFYDIAAPITAEDFFDRDLDSPIQIRVTYGNLRTDEQEEFRTYVRADELIVTKRISSENGRILQRYYAAPSQIPEFARIRAMASRRDRIAAWKTLVDDGEWEGLTQRARAADQVEQFMSRYEANHPELMKPVERQEQFFGPKNIGGGKLDKFTQFVLVPAVREAADEVVGKKGAIYQILDMIVVRQINTRPDIQQFKSQLEQTVKELYSSANLTELPELGKSISQTLEKYAPGSELNLTWGEVQPPDIRLPEAKATLIEDTFEGEITRKGHGLQRALILTLLQHLAMTVPAAESDSGSVEQETETGEGRGPVPLTLPDLILAVEEPELYLHPSRCRYLCKVLRTLAESPQIQVGATNQIIYTSHSPYFVDLHRFDQIRVVRKVPSPDSEAPQSVVTSFPLEEGIEKLAEVWDTDPNKFTSDSFRARALAVMNTVVNEGFFADVVVVVEGSSDMCTLWKLQEIMGEDWDRRGIVVVPAGGKNNIDRPMVVFSGFDIPTYFMFDGDSQHQAKPDHRTQTVNCNHAYLRLAGAELEDFPETRVHPTWAVFKEDLESVCKEALGGDTFESIRQQVAHELGYDSSEQACGSIQGAARFIELVYDRKHRIKILEDIVRNITQLSTVRRSRRLT